MSVSAAAVVVAFVRSLSLRSNSCSFIQVHQWTQFYASLFANSRHLKPMCTRHCRVHCACVRVRSRATRLPVESRMIACIFSQWIHFASTRCLCVCVCSWDSHQAQHSSFIRPPNWRVFFWIWFGFGALDIVEIKLVAFEVALGVIGINSID